MLTHRIRFTTLLLTLAAVCLSGCAQTIRNQLPSCGLSGAEVCHTLTVSSRWEGPVEIRETVEVHRGAVQLFSGDAEDTRAARVGLSSGALMYSFRQQRLRFNVPHHDATVHSLSTCGASSVAGGDDYECQSIAWAERKDGESWATGSGDRKIIGTFEELVVHPELPIIGTLSGGCCDAPAELTVYSFAGDRICSSVKVLEAWANEVFRAIKLVNGRVVCPTPLSVQ